VIALAVAFGAALFAQHHLLRADVLEGDALVHQYWMRSFADPGLFQDPVTAALRDSQRYPDAYVELFRLASHVVDPIVFGEWLGIALMALAGWLVFLIVRELSDWRPAPWLGMLLFLALDGHRFAGGFPRAFLHAFVLATVLLLLRGRVWAAAVVPAIAMFVYPPAAVLAAGVLVLSVRRDRIAPVALGVVLVGVSLAIVDALAGGAPVVFTRAEARGLPEFGEHGAMHFFVSSPIEYLRQNRSGFDLRATGCVLAVAALLAIALSPRARRLPREVWALPAVALGAWAIAQLVLFRLYLPHRYTYPLLAFFAIACAVAVRPAWEDQRVSRRLLALLAPAAAFVLGLGVLPLHPPSAPHRLETWWVLAGLGVSVALAVPAARLRPSWGAGLTGLALLAAVLAAPGRHPPGQLCPQTPASRFLATLPEDAVIGGDPIDLKCVPVTARRAVVMSVQLVYSYEKAYFAKSRPRLFATLQATYGHSAEGIDALRRRYGATHLWIRRDQIGREQAGRGRWKPGRRAPYGGFVRRLLAHGSPASLTLPARCRAWRSGGSEVYDLRCVEEGGPAPGRPTVTPDTGTRADHSVRGVTRPSTSGPNRRLSVRHRAQVPRRARRWPATRSRPATAR
jgi:hypothetical protein